MSDGDFEDIFYVLLPDNQVETLSLDELDEAFQADRIAETALVCRVGGTTWVTLAELASVDDEPEPPAPSVASLPSAPVYFAPTTPPAAYVPPSSRAPDSVAPYAFDLSRSLDDDLELEALALRPKRRALWVVSGLATVGVAAVAALVVMGGVAASASGTGQAAAMLKPPAAALPAPVETTLAPPPPAPAAPPVAAAAAQTEEAPAKERFDEDMKRALLEADAKPVGKKAVAAVKKSSKLRKAKPGKPKSKRSKGKGNAYDPLNGSL